MEDNPGALERPVRCSISIDDTADYVKIAVPGRHLGLLWFVFAFNVCAVVFFALAGIAYLVYHIPLINGLPLEAPKPHTVAAERWYLGVGIGWLAALSAMAYGFGLVWLPLMASEVITFAETGVTVAQNGVLRKSVFRSDWLNVAEIALTRDREKLRPSRLVVTLLSGSDCLLAENATECDREWLASICRVCAARFER